MAASARHETRALLRAHLAAASSYGHLTSRCPACHRLLRLAMEAAPRPVPAAAAPQAPCAGQGALSGAVTAREPLGVLDVPETVDGEQPSTT
ncbi:DUF6274 family protein [Streptomyces sp. NRRL S-340]|uniref:DUF6274 family protein n=1 Tax=Streptomyces sp. NRRL S-340 TaxID=1463901 RepID=UPI00055E0A83|nr:DUF6274 family protein [Streptomyces sp. NRRL S-340]